MQPRFIIKTHTEALKPRNYSLLIAKCTFPDRSAYPEAVIKRLQEWIKEKSVAKFTVLLSTKKNRGFGFLLDNMIWNWKGHVINTVLCYLGKKGTEDPEVFEELTKIERICYLRYFLETEGALILKFAERFNKIAESLSYSYLRDNIQEIFKEIYEEYMDIAPDFRTRIKIREVYSLMKSKERYDESTLAHKIKPHIQALADLGILSVDRKNSKEVYRPLVSDGVSPFDVFSKELVNFKKMEEVFLNDGYFSLIAKALDLKPLNYSPELHRELLKQSFLYGYEVMRDKVTGMADIDALIDWCCIKLLSEENILVSRKDIEGFLAELRKINPSSIRYHVNGRGRIAYLILEL